MKAVKRIIPIVLMLGLLAEGCLLIPSIRFRLDLYTMRFDHAGSVYLAHMNDPEQKMTGILQDYLDRQLDKYRDRTLSYNDVTNVLTLLSRSVLPQEDIQRCIRTVDELETARNDLARADALADGGDYANAIPLYRLSLAADDDATLRLENAETQYRKSILEEAEKAMEIGDLDQAEQVLAIGMDVLGADDEDLSAAAWDVIYMKKEQATAALMAEARRLLQTDGPEAAIAFMCNLRHESPDDAELRYLEQVILHECEDHYCAQALTLRDSDDLSGACSLLKEALLLIDSSRIKALLAELRGSTLYPLNGLPVTRDETGIVNTGVQSTVAWDRILQDCQANTYSHSLSADMGSISFALEDDFTVFAGTVAFPMGEKTDAYRSSASLQIFGDGTLLAEFKDVDSFSEPTPFFVPVEGVRELTLRWTCDGANGWKDWGRFVTVFDGRFLTTASLSD